MKKIIEVQFWTRADNYSRRKTKAIFLAESMKEYKKSIRFCGENGAKRTIKHDDIISVNFYWEGKNEDGLKEEYSKEIDFLEQLTAYESELSKMTEEDAKVSLKGWAESGVEDIPESFFQDNGIVLLCFLWNTYIV